MNWIKELQNEMLDTQSDSLQIANNKNIVLDKQKQEQEHFSIYNEKSPEELDFLQNKIFNMQKDVSGEQKSYQNTQEEINKSIETITKESETLDELQSKWNKMEEEYIQRAPGLEKVPAALRSIFNVYPKDHELYSGGMTDFSPMDILFGGEPWVSGLGDTSKKKGKLRNKMDEIRYKVGIESVKKSNKQLENIYKKPIIERREKALDNLQHEYWKGSSEKYSPPKAD